MNPKPSIRCLVYVLWLMAALTPSMLRAQVARLTVDEALLKRTSEGETVSVIAELNLAARGAGALDNEGLAKQDRSIAMAQDTVLAQLAKTRHRVVRRFIHIPFVALEVDKGALDALLAPGVVKGVVEDRSYPFSQVTGGSTDQRSSPFVEADLAHDAGFDGSGWAVAILDTGVEASHPYFGGRVVEEACFSTNGDCPGGFNQLFGPGSGTPCTFNPIECEHGTHVAGIAAGSTTGLTGVASGADIIAMQVFSNVGGRARTYDSDFTAALERVFDLRMSHQIAAVNMSIGGSTHSGFCNTVAPAATAAIGNLATANIAVVIASGNDGNKGGISFPGCISTAISVGATGDTRSNAFDFDAVTGFSNSASFLRLLAPGASILSSVTGGGYRIKSGTSMAAPHVAGAWAVIKQQNPIWTPAQVLAQLQSSGFLVTDTNAVTTPSLRVAKALFGGTPQVANDRFATQILLFGASGGLFTNSFPATKETGEPAHAGLSGGSSVWFKWLSPPFLPGRQFLTQIETTGSAFDTGLSVYTGTDLSSLTLVAENDDLAPGIKQSRVQFTADQQRHYLIAVDGFGGQAGDLNLFWNAGDNNNFNQRLPLSGLAGQATSSNTFANKEAGEPNHAGQAGGASMWWKWTAPVAGSFTFDTVGSSFDTLLGIYTGDLLASLTPVASDDDSAGGGASTVDFTAQAGIEYQIAVDGDGGAEGDITLNWQIQSLTETLYSADPRGPELRIVDPNTAVTVSSVDITLPGETVDGVNGLATNPRTGELYALLKLLTRPTRELAIVNPATGEAVGIGDTGEKFAAIAFDCSENLYGVTGDGASTPETLYALDRTDATPTLLTALGRGDDGEALAFNPADGLLYHSSGNFFGTIIFESIDPVTLATSDIPIGPPLTQGQVQALTYWPSQGELLWKHTETPGPLYRVTTSGAATLLGNMDHQAKGLAFVGIGLGCPDRVRVQISGNGVVTASGISCPGTCEQTYANGSNLVLTADAPVAGWSFTGWGGACAGHSNPCTITTSVDTLVTASFASSTVFADGFESGDVSAWSATVP